MNKSRSTEVHDIQTVTGDPASGQDFFRYSPKSKGSQGIFRRGCRNS